jgi:hypothetical protein
MLGPSSEYNLSLVRKLKRAFAMPFIRTIHSGMMALLGGDVLVQDDPGSNLRGFSSHLADYLVLHRRLSRSRRTQHIIRLIDRASLLIRSHSKGFACIPAIWGALSEDAGSPLRPSVPRLYHLIALHGSGSRQPVLDKGAIVFDRFLSRRALVCSTE